MSSVTNGFGNRPRPTQKAYRAAVAKIVRDLKARHHLSNVDFADRIGCSDETVSNAENERTDLNPVLLLNIEHEFGTGTIDPVTELAGTHGVPQDMAQGGDILPALMKVGCQMVEARSEDSPGGSEEVAQELFSMEPGLIDIRRGANRLLAKIKRLREG